jgi:hypothetical protein
MRRRILSAGVVGMILAATTAQPATIRALAVGSTTIGAAPKDCPAGTNFVSLPNLFGDGKAYGGYIGGDPVWVGGFSGPRATLHFKGISPPYDPDYGWGRKVLFALKRGFGGTVTLSGGDLNGPARLWFDAVEIGAPYGEVHRLPLAAKLQDARPGGAGPRQWPTFPGGIVVPRAGCYYLQATWPGGTWRITFAAGL